MAIPTGSVFYSQGGGSVPEDVEIPVYSTRLPTSYDVRYPVGKRWVVTTSTNVEYVLTSFTSTGGLKQAVWTNLVLNNSTGIARLLPSSGTSPVTPVDGIVGLVGDGTNINTVGATGALGITLTNNLMINNLTLSGTGGIINITDKNSSTAACGNATLVAGQVVVHTTACTASSLVFISPTAAVGSVGYQAVTNVASGQFVISSTDGGDASSFNWLIIG